MVKHIFHSIFQPYSNLGEKEITRDKVVHSVIHKCRVSLVLSHSQSLCFVLAHCTAQSSIKTNCPTVIH